ncbi:hypothetical protein FNV43_RR01285 [Rhamnella rubrinervis]|uniref:Calmodulin n=1 Tax=Rhamnella rubrinervis TaxID=2594499 RepID=A0A8K0HPC0_9ROSA|nr:hypothetical protein FNV43_RR01285 [Rhamnella rubrinervis]
MKEIREAAVAYCKNMPEDVREKASSLFQSMDTSGDNKISCAEFSNHKELEVCGDQKSVQRLFEELDENGDKFLDLVGLYFTCRPCFDQGDSFANYCTACYSNGRHRSHEHDHEAFVDNYVLLLSKAGSTCGAAEETLMQSKSLQSGDPYNTQSGPFQAGEPNRAQSILRHLSRAMGLPAARKVIGQATEAIREHLGV